VAGIAVQKEKDRRMPIEAVQVRLRSSAPAPERVGRLIQRKRRWAILAGIGALAFVTVAPTAPGLAQLRSDPPGVRTPYGLAPLSFADIVEKVRPAVVSISVTDGGARVARKDTPRPPGRGAPDQFPFPDLPEDHPLNEFFKNLPREFRGAPTPRPVQAQGSGFVISADGYVVTNNHVVDGAGKVTVSFDEHNKHEADVVGTDPRTDLALLKIKSGQTFPFVKFSEKPIRVGDWALAVGNPFGLGGTVTAGIVSALGRDIGSGPYDYLQIDAAVNRGNSGGPTFNLDGEVVGVNTAIYSPSGGNVGIAFAVPAKIASEVVTQLKATGSVNRGWLGVKIQSVDEDIAASLGLGEVRGALINEVTPNGPAAAAGLKTQDAILAVNGEKIADSRELARKIAEFAPSTTVDLKIMRQNKEQTVKVKLGTFPNTRDEIARLEEGKPAATEMGALGLSFAPGRAPRSGVREGVLVADVEPGSDAAAKGLKAGDTILEVNSQTVSSAGEVEDAVKKAKDLGRPAVLLTVKSAEQKRIVAVQIKKG
jgi:serine protease Do